MEPMMEDIKPGDMSPEHVVQEHRVGLGRMHKLDGSGTEHGVVLGMFDGQRDEPWLVCVRLLTPQQADELGLFLIETAARARECNRRPPLDGKEGC